MWDKRTLAWMMMTPEQRKQKINNALWRMNLDMGRYAEVKNSNLVSRDILRQRYRTNIIQLMLSENK